MPLEQSWCIAVSPSSPDTLKVYGNGFTTGVTQLGGNNINFGRILIEHSKDTSVTINNIGNDTLKISSINSTGRAFISHTAIMNILPGAAFIDTISFAPTTLGAQGAGFIIKSSSPTSPDVLTVSGICLGFRRYNSMQKQYPSVKLEQVNIRILP